MDLSHQRRLPSQEHLLLPHPQPLHLMEELVFLQADLNPLTVLQFLMASFASEAPAPPRFMGIQPPPPLAVAFLPMLLPRICQVAQGATR